MMRIVSIVVAALMLLSCEKTVETPVSMGYNYFPIQANYQYTYRIDSIWVDCKVGIRDTYRLELREVLDTFFTDASGNQAIRIERYFRNVGQSDWRLSKVWFANLTARTAERIEENIRFIKLVFPVMNNTSWDGNAKNFITDWGSDYQYESVDVPFAFKVVNVDSAATVMQKNQESLINLNRFKETYARNIGLVYAERIQIDGIYPTPDPNDCEELIPGGQVWTTVPVINRISYGYVVQQWLVNHGPL